jgi:hypothetical protein
MYGSFQVSIDDVLTFHMESWNLTWDLLGRTRKANYTGTFGMKPTTQTTYL